jgi:predicted dinucleotide-binding enzyme
MNIGVLGTGMVGRALATRLIEVGHAVAMGTREGGSSSAAAEWLALVGRTRNARVGTFAEAASFGALVINATSGQHSLQALSQAGDRNLHGKVLLDVANPIAHTETGPLTLTVANTDSLAEQIQRAFPDARVVKALNTVNAEVMIHPARLGEEHTAFVAGDDAEAKATVADLLRSFGWRSILDLGGIEAARGMEMYLSLWVALAQATGTSALNVRIVRA